MRVTARVPGTVCWFDIASPDLEATKRFYGDLLGWTAQDSPEPDSGGYGFFVKGDATVAGYMSQQNPMQPVAWTPYFTSVDADASAKSVESAGGVLFMPPIDVMTVGRMAVCGDPAGAVFGLWQSEGFGGFDIRDEPGGYCWAELASPDTSTAAAFYGEVFGWAAEEVPMGDAPYTIFKQGDAYTGGLFTPDPSMTETAPNWLLYVNVDDCDTTVAAAERSGATVIVPPTTMSEGRFARIADPQGAHLGVITPPQHD